MPPSGTFAWRVFFGLPGLPARARRAKAPSIDDYASVGWHATAGYPRGESRAAWASQTCLCRKAPANIVHQVGQSNASLPRNNYLNAIRP